MNKLKKNQLVACWDREDCDKAIRIYVGREGEYHRCRTPGIVHCHPDFELWDYCVPLEELAPEVFLAKPALVQRLRRQQIAWLCQELAHADMCPSVSAIASCDKDCPRCWRDACRKAVKEGGDDAG